MMAMEWDDVHVMMMAIDGGAMMLHSNNTNNALKRYDNILRTWDDCTTG
jgi:hypothetical protein